MSVSPQADVGRRGGLVAAATPPARPRRCVRNSEVKRARRLFDEGWLLHEIADDVGVAESTVSRWVNGLTRKEAGWPGDPPPRASRPGRLGEADARPVAAPRALPEALSADGTPTRKGQRP